MHILGSKVALPLSAFSYGGLVQLPIVASNPLDQIPYSVGASAGIATDAAGIHLMRLGQLMGDTRLLREVSIGQMHIREACFHLFIDTPSHNAHVGRITQAGTPARDQVLLLPAMNEVMARLTQDDEIVGTISTGFS